MSFVLVCTSAKTPPSASQVRRICTQEVLEDVLTGDDKNTRGEGAMALQRNVIKQLTTRQDGGAVPSEVDVKRAFKKATTAALRRMVENRGTRQDGRRTTEVRPIDIRMKPLPAQVHGSVLFTRGETQALATTTLGDTSMAQ
ncbi:MAG: hypothetical protein SGPRY_005373, partial [Prymnesium sp.]